MRTPPGAEGTGVSEDPPPADLPAFGKGIAFVPRSRRGAASGSASGAAAADGRAVGAAEDGAGGDARGGGGKAGAAGVDRLGGGQGAMALDGGLTAEDGAEEVH